MRFFSASCAFRTACAMAVATVATAQSTADYTLRGPCGAATLNSRLAVGDAADVDVLVTYPTSCAGGPFPVVYMFNGFQARAPWYSGIVQHVASWGHVVVQYTLPGLLPVVVDRIELGYLQPLMDWLAAQSASAASPLYGLPDATRIATMGHSRGGKLATLHYAGRPDIATAVLLDPVDGSSMTPEGLDYPSSTKALAAANKTAAVVGAGITGSCNPEAQNYKKFFSAAGPGSWLMVIKQAGHFQFARSGNPIMDWSLDRLCKSGKASSQAVITSSAAFAVAWLQATFRPQESKDGVEAFRAWLDGQVAAGIIIFNVAAKAATAAATATGAVACTAAAKRTASCR